MAFYVEITKAFKKIIMSRPQIIEEIVCSTNYIS
jgi:hypothetical protein